MATIIIALVGGVVLVYAAGYFGLRSGKNSG
jgi:hypothetical protein